jgi:hypothetical protein
MAQNFGVLKKNLRISSIIKIEDEEMKIIPHSAADRLVTFK